MKMFPDGGSAGIALALLLTSCAHLPSLAVKAEGDTKQRCEAATTEREKNAIMQDANRVRALYDRANGEPGEALKAKRDEADRACGVG